jgi:hypothetical protein
VPRFALATPVAHASASERVAPSDAANVYSAWLLVALALPLQAPDMASEVRSLVRDLDASQRSTRDAAEQKLIEFGPGALALLPDGETGDSAELVLRLNRIRQALLRAKAEGTLKGSTVTLSVADAPLADVLADVEKQTGNKLVDYRRAFGQQVDDLKVSFDLKQTPFWQAFDKLAGATGLEPYPFAAEDGLALVSRAAEGSAPRSPPPTCDVGAFRTRVRRLTVGRDFALDDPALELDLEIAWEPRLRPMFFTAAIANIEMVDDADNRLAPPNPDLVLEIPPQGRASQIEAKFQVAAPARSRLALKRVAGRIDVLLPADQHTFRFRGLADATKQEQRAAAATVTLDDFRAVDDVWQIRLRLRYQHPANALESHRAWFYKNPAFLETADGTRTPPGTIELVRQADDELTLNLVFPAPEDAAPRTFVYQTPADLVTLPIAFEFHDLPLP